MPQAKSTVFMSGRNQAVRIPAKMRFAADVKEVVITEQNGSLIITPKRQNWAGFFALVREDADFPARPSQGDLPKRESL